MIRSHKNSSHVSNQYKAVLLFTIFNSGKVSTKAKRFKPTKILLIRSHHLECYADRIIVSLLKRPLRSHLYQACGRRIWSFWSGPYGTCISMQHHKCNPKPCRYLFLWWSFLQSQVELQPFLFSFDITNNICTHNIKILSQITQEKLINLWLD